MNIESLYQELIIDHGTQPRNFSVLINANGTATGYNPLCGDKVQIYLHIVNNIIQDASFMGAGCAISTASASLMCETLKGKSCADVLRLSQQFKSLLTEGCHKVAVHDLGKLVAFSGVNAYPARVKCATLPWHALEAAILQNANTVSTETDEEVLK